MINCQFNTVFDPHFGNCSCVALLPASLQSPAANTTKLTGTILNSFAGPEVVNGAQVEPLCLWHKEVRLSSDSVNQKSSLIFSLANF